MSNETNGNGLCGLVNMGNTCFLNTCLQCLSNVDLLRKYFLTNAWKEDVDRERKETVFAIEFYKLINGIWEEDGCSIKPMSFVQEFFNLISLNDLTNIRFGQHNDSSESLNYILDWLHEALKYEIDITYTGKPKNNLDKLMIESIKAYNKKDYSEITKIFSGQEITQIFKKDGTKEVISSNFQLFNVIALPISKDFETIFDCFDKYVSNDELVGINQYFYEKENQKIDAIKKTSLWKLPPILIISFKRFNNRNRKINKKVDFPISGLNLSKYTDGYDKTESIYDLIGIGNHIGGTVGGHYYAYCKSKDGWYEYNDSSIRKLDNDNLDQKLITGNAYFLIYKKIK